MSTKYPRYPERMTAAYRQLYEIETTFRYIIDRTLTATIGPYWRSYIYVKRDFDKLNYYELIPFFAQYPQLERYFTDSQRTQLYKLNGIRNKICHMQNLKTKEYEYLAECHKLVTATISAKAT